MLRDHKGGPASPAWGGQRTLPREVTGNPRPKEQGCMAGGRDATRAVSVQEKQGQKSHTRLGVSMSSPATKSSQQMSSCCPSPAQKLCLCCRGWEDNPSSWWPLNPDAPGIPSGALQRAPPCSPALSVFVQHSWQRQRHLCFCFKLYFCPHVTFFFLSS